MKLEPIYQEPIIHTIPAHHPQSRIDSYLAKKFPHFSRSFFARLIDQNLITVNGNAVQKHSLLIKEHDVLTITFPKIASPSTLLHVKDLGITIEYEHEHFLIVSKPANVIVHKPSSFSESITLTDWLTATFSDISAVGSCERPGIVHRLDKDTSGLLIIARTNYAHTVFGTMFKDRTIQKTYHAIVQGHPERSGTINLAIGRHPVTRNKMTTFAAHQASNHAAHNGNRIRHALTTYTVLRYFKDHSLVEIKPLTGRTHQIRVHFAAIGHPILGDSLYGKKSSYIERQALHAQGLSFIFDSIPFSFSKNTPADFNTVLEKLD